MYRDDVLRSCGEVCQTHHEGTAMRPTPISRNAPAPVHFVSKYTHCPSIVGKPVADALAWAAPPTTIPTSLRSEFAYAMPCATFLQPCVLYGDFACCGSRSGDAELVEQAKHFVHHEARASRAQDGKWTRNLVDSFSRQAQLGTLGDSIGREVAQSTMRYELQRWSGYSRESTHELFCTGG